MIINKGNNRHSHGRSCMPQCKLTRVMLLFVLLIAVLIGVSGCEYLDKPGGFEESQVDISSLKLPSASIINDPAQLQARLETLNLVKEGVPASKEDTTAAEGVVWARTNTINDYNLENTLSIKILIFDDSDKASNYFSGLKRINMLGETYPDLEKARKTIKVTQDTSAVLYPAYRFRNNIDDCYRLDSKRELYSFVRIGKAVVSMYETSQQKSATGLPTSKKLAEICRALEE